MTEIRLYWYSFGLSAGFTLFMVSLIFLYLRKIRRYEAMSAEEKAEIEAEKARRERDRQLRQAIRKEANHLVKEIPHHLAIQHRFESFYRPGGVSKRQQHRSGKKAQRVEFEAVMLTKTEMWFKINGRKLPSGTSFYDLKKPENHVLDNLQYGIGRPCRWFEDKEFNLFLRVGLKNSLMGVPTKVLWRDVVDQLPKSRPLAFIVGVNEYGRAVYQDIKAWPHGLILGGTGGGKSVGLKQILITLIKNNSPNNLQMHIVDLKRIELPQFADAPQVAGFYNRAHEVPGILDKLHAEMERRLDLFEGVCNNLAGWNRQNPHNRLPRLLFVVDELAILTRSDYKKEAIKRIAELASLGRGVGIHLLMATQTVTKEVLTIDILANIEGRICYSVRNTTASTLAIGNGAAVGLSPPGRCVFVDGLYDHYLQTPYASQEDIIEVLEKASADPEEEEKPPEPLEFLATIALTNYGGRASYRDLYNDYANQAAPWKIGEKRVRDTLSAAEYNPKESDNATTVEHDGKTYILTPGNIVSGAQSRWFIPVNGHLPDGDELEDQLRRVMQQRLDPEKAAPS